MFGYARVEYSVPPFSERREPSWLIRRDGQTLPPPSPLKSEAGLFSLCCKNRIETVWLEDCSRSRRGDLRSGGLMEPRMPELGGRRFAGSGRQAENGREALGHPASVRCAGEAIRAPSVIADPAACCLRSLQHRGPPSRAVYYQCGLSVSESLLAAVTASCWWMSVGTNWAP